MCIYKCHHNVTNGIYLSNCSRGRNQNQRFQFHKLFWEENNRSVIKVLQVTAELSLTRILPTPKVNSLCHQYRACTSVQSILLADQLQVFILKTLKTIRFKKFGRLRVKFTISVLLLCKGKPLMVCCVVM